MGEASNMNAYLREPTRPFPRITKHAAELAIKIGTGELEQVGWKLCKDGSLWSLDNPDHAGRCPDCEPVFRVVAAPEREDD